MARVIVADLTRVDGSAESFLKQITTDIPILLINRQEHLVFNEEILELSGKPFIVGDFIENGWNWDMAETLVVGQNTVHFKDACQSGWERLDYFLAQNEPLKYFKRELLKKDRTDWLCPIEYPATLPIPEPDTKEQFDNRVLQVHNTWGLSHEDRKRVHAEIWLSAGKYGYSVCDSPFYLQPFIKHEGGNKKWFTANIPWYSRLPMDQILYINGLAKISLSLPGAGRKCFRHSESPINSTMFMIEDEIAWSYDWVSGDNCIKSEAGKEIETIVGWLNSPDLFEIYLSGISNCKKYETESYINNYILPLINKV